MRGLNKNWKLYSQSALLSHSQSNAEDTDFEKSAGFRKVPKKILKQKY